jgi:hypothetical protein
VRIAIERCYHCGMKTDVVGLVAAGWTLACFATGVLLHFRLASELEAAGRPIERSRITTLDVESEYVALCRERNTSPWPKLRYILIFGAVGLPGWVVALVRML